jgi:hypothetical protein
VVIARHNEDDLDELAQACALQTLRLPVAHTVPLEDAIPALTELELNHAPRGGKLIITMNERDSPINPVHTAAVVETPATHDR